MDGGRQEWSGCDLRRDALLEIEGGRDGDRMRGFGFVSVFVCLCGKGMGRMEDGGWRMDNRQWVGEGKGSK